MPEAASTRQPPSKKCAIASLAVLTVGGSLSGAIVGSLSGLAELFLLYRDALPYAWENGLLSWLMADTFLAKVPYGAMAGLLGGMLTFALSLYWSAAASWKNAALFWGTIALLAVGGLGAWFSNTSASFKMGQMIAAGILGATFGALLSAFAAILGKLVGHEKARMS